MELNIEISGYQSGDLEQALDEVKRRVSEGFTTGWNKNSTGSYSFSLEGDEIESFFVAPADVDENELAERVDEYEQHSSLELAEDEGDGDDAVFGVMAMGGITRIGDC